MLCFLMAYVWGLTLDSVTETSVLAQELAETKALSFFL